MRPLDGITVITLEYVITAALCDPENHLGPSEVMVDRVLSRIRDR
jgi:hypothetical protein